MKQYWEIKSQHLEHILFFRMGDFYELFFEDATKVAPILGIALTSRNKKAQDETPMCGMPYHSVSTHINRLLSLGFKVALCDQVEDPKTAKGIVRRAVTRVMTPGMVYDVDSLEQTRSHYLAAFDESTLSFLDMSTGEAFYLKTQEIEKFLNLYPVVELVLSLEQKQKFSFLEKTFVISELPVEKMLQDSRAQLESSQRLLSYVTHYNSDQNLSFISEFKERATQGRLILLPTTQRHLELFYNSKNEKNDSLFATLDKCKTSAGSRKLREWLQFPMLEKSSIENRLNQVEYYLKDLPKLKKIRETLSQLGDLERRLAKISQSTGHARDLLSLALGLDIAARVLSLAEVEFLSLEKLLKHSSKLISSLKEEAPLTIKNGGMIKTGVSAELDELIHLSTDSHRILSELETREKQATQISSLKIRYNQVFGYYIEITHTHQDKVPAHYKRKQTLATAERFYTEELLELEKKILSADQKRAGLEYEIFEKLKSETLDLSAPITWLAQVVAEIDATTNLSWLAIENNYTRPEFSEIGNLQITASRHPVVEKSVSPFMANDIHLSHQEAMLLTGPNMAGKSTLMRQVALTAILAQMGSFVPAKKCVIPIYDQIFTRIGAQDMLSEGLSTFMVEMTETAELIKHATVNSLVVLDEIGRGTSTYDGLSLAESILEFLLKKGTSQILFATHYHEITTLIEKYPQLKNAHMSVVESHGQIQFLHSLVDGAAGKSYGIQVAELAGLPLEIIKSAQLKEKALRDQHKNTGKSIKSISSQEQLSFLDKDCESSAEWKEKWEKLKNWSEQIKQFNFLEKTPLETLRQLEKWQSELKNESFI